MLTLNITPGVCMPETSPLIYAYLKHHHWPMYAETLPQIYAYLKHHPWHMLTRNITKGLYIIEISPGGILT